MRNSSLLWVAHWGSEVSRETPSTLGLARAVERPGEAAKYTVCMRLFRTSFSQGEWVLVQAKFGCEAGGCVSRGVGQDLEVLTPRLDVAQWTSTGVQCAATMCFTTMATMTVSPIVTTGPWRGAAY